MINPTWPSPELVAITPSDTTTYAQPIRQLYVGTGGDVTVVDQKDNVVLFTGVLDGFYITPIYIKQVKSTGTTAQNLVAFF